MASLKEKTAKGLLWGGIGNGGMQLLNLFFGIFLARILDSTDYGMVAVLTIFSAIAGVFCDSGFSLAIVNKKTVSRDDYNSVFWFSFGMGATLYAILYFCAPFIARFYGTPELESLARFQFLSFVFSSLGTAHSAYLFRNIMVKQRSIITMTAMVISGTVGLVCALSGMRYWGIATQTVTYTLFTTILLWAFSPFRPQLKFKVGPLKEMLPFSSKMLLTSAFAQINLNVFSALLGRFYTVTTAGFYSQGNKWVTMGYATINGTVNGIGQPVFREAGGELSRLKNVFRKIMRFTAFVSFPAMLGLAIVSKELIVIAVSEKWLPSVPIMQILCVWGAFLPISTLYYNLMNSLGRPNIYMWNTICLGIVQIACLVGSAPYGLTTMLVIYTAINILWLFIWHYFAHKYIGITLLETLKDITPYIAISALIMILTAYATASIGNIYVSLFVKIFMAAALYAGLMWALDSKVFKESICYLLKKKVD